MRDYLDRPIVTVCICTFRRPLLLSDLLQSIAQQTYPLNRIEVVIVDNDHSESARDVVESFALTQPILSIFYAVEKTQGISFARNRTVQMAHGDFLAFIDDDERASPEWLEHLFSTLRGGGFSAVLGPVIPIYPEGTPSWIKESNFFERPRHLSGKKINSDNGRTSNAIVIADLARSRLPYTFDPKFAHSGSEDHDFFRWIEARGGTLGWCDEASVVEVVPPSRQKLSFMLERAMRTSTTYWRSRYADASFLLSWKEGIKGFVGIVVFGLLGFIALASGMHHAARCWIISAKGFGRLLALTQVTLKGY